MLPGLELTWNDLDPRTAAHVVAVGLRTFVGVDDGLEPALTAARSAGAALVAAHPYPSGDPRDLLRATQRFAHERGELLELVDRLELFNRNDLFAWVAEAGLPSVATGDFHRLQHLATWKTLLPCERSAEAVVAYLASPRPTYLTRLDERALSRAA